MACEKTELAWYKHILQPPGNSGLEERLLPCGRVGRDRLLEDGVAICCNNLPVLAYKIDTLLDDPKRLAAMQSKARRIGRPDAACDIVNRMLALKQDGR